MSSYEALRSRAEAAIDSGDFDRALRLLDQALELAESAGDLVLLDRAFCNRSSVLISLGKGEEVISPLREILVRNTDEMNCHLAAYNIARAYEYRKEHKKGLFYARIALARADHLTGSDASVLHMEAYRASTHNQIGNLLVADSRFEDAIAEYLEALELDRSSPELGRAAIQQNLGYCYLVLGRHAEGFELLYRSLRVLRRHRFERQVASAHLDLCFGHLEISRYRTAKRHGLEALRLAEQTGDSQIKKNALYLLGEASHLLGQEDDARRFFDLLQTYFPESPHIADFLLAVNVRQLINLRA